MSQAIAKLQQVKTWSGKKTDRFELKIGLVTDNTSNKIVQVLTTRSVLDDVEVKLAIKQALQDLRMQNIVLVESPASKAFAKAQKIQ
jgi:hypothetical protein